MVIRPMRSGDEQPVTKYRPMSALSRFVPDPWSEIIGRGRTIGRNKPGAWGENARGAAGQAVFGDALELLVVVKSLHVTNRNGCPPPNMCLGQDWKHVCFSMRQVARLGISFCRCATHFVNHRAAK